jgi:uncharacterized membrane protein
MRNTPSATLSRSSLEHLAWLTAAILSVALLALPFVFRLDGKPHADWQQFLGRFHPLVVHLPIGLILLIPVLELAGRYRPALLEAAAFLLPLSVLACLSAVTLGYLLAYGSGQMGAGVTRHMWGGIALTIAMIACALARPWLAQKSLQGAASGIYPGMLFGVVLLLSWAAHQGGALTHGDNYLTEYLPAPLKPLLGHAAKPAKSDGAPGSFYAEHIHPVLDANCASCHGDGNVKGGLRVDTFDLLMKGGTEGAAIVPGDAAKSLLFERITLPTDHKKFMPSEGRPPLKAEQILWIKTWIVQGASPTATSLTGIALPDAAKDAPPPPVGDYSALKQAMVQVAKAAGVTLTPMSKNPADGLILNTVDASAAFTDAQLATFQPFAPYVVEVELGRTSVTDASFETLAKFTHLRALHLEGTAVTGAGLEKLMPLQQLTYLNLSGTKVSDASIKPLGTMKSLQHVYLYNTSAHPIGELSAATRKGL